MPLILKSGREKSVFNRHPWLFSGAIQQLPQAESGEIVEVHSQDGKRLGYAFFDANSQITARIFEFTRKGKEVTIDENYWKNKIQNAFQLRQKHLISPQTNAYRLIHAEGDFFPGLIVDIYGQVAVLQILIKGTEQILPEIVQGLETLGFPYCYVKTKESSRRLEKMGMASGWLGDEPKTPTVIQENGLKFPVNIETGQKTGFFLDQRANRQLLQSYAQGQKVLNAFSYTGGFSVYALAGGASEVHSVDISQEAIDTGEQSVALNFSEAPHQSICQDCFDYLKQTSEMYDVMVLDPPAFAKNKRAVPNASRGYISLNELGIKRLKPGGLLFTFSCSGSIDRDLFRKIIFTACAEVGREVRILHQLSQPLDHPINIYHPEGEYLKGLVLEVA